jgi:alginate O-acetyltransferase complex protein AlgI
MVFNSWIFVGFFLLVCLLYFQFRHRAQNVLLLVASYVFYAWWDWRFLSLLLFSTVVDWWLALKIEDSDEPGARKRMLLVSLISNFSVLGFFKYYNFFADSLARLLQGVGIEVSVPHLAVILPVGISFYTFNSLSYTIDVYLRHIQATRSLPDFALFVSFFPHLVAGPIMRATVLLPQVLRERVVTLSMVEEGLWLMLWGFFKKVVVADNLALQVDGAFARSAELNGPMAYLAVVAFAFQIYCDFSGYTDIARGCAKILGFNILHNFNRPYTATDPQDFWRRWHISLSTWLRDYLYIPLGGSHGSRGFVYRNLMITMVLGGLWHGASWNFVWWGVYHGALLVAYHAYARWSGAPAVPRWLAIAVQFQFTLFGWLLFRCTRGELKAGRWDDQSFEQILEFLGAPWRGMMPGPDALALVGILLLYVTPLLLVERLVRFDREDRGFLDRPTWQLVTAYGLLSFLIVRYGVQNATAFIYFQF